MSSDFCGNCGKTRPPLLKCASCSRTKYCSPECQRQHWAVHRSKCQALDLQQWSPQTVDAFVDFMLEQIDVHKVLYLLDPNVAQKFKAHSHEDGEECSHTHHEIHMREDLTPLERALAQVISRSHLYEILPSFAQQTARILKNIKQKGLEDRLTFDLETEKQLTKEVITESLQRTLVEEVNKVYRKEDGTESKQPLLLAHPSGYREDVNRDLNTLDSEAVASFMTNDFVVIDNFLPVDDLDPLYREAEYLDFDGRFEEVIQQKVKGLRTDKTLWVSKKLFEDAFSGNHEKPLHLSLSYCPKLRDLLNLFYSFPFELNKKTILGLQACELLMLDCYFSGCFYKLHKDSGFGEGDTGRKVTCIFMLPETSGGVVRVNEQEVELRRNRMLVFKARKVEYEVLPTPNKTFLFTYFISGPCDSKQ